MTTGDKDVLQKALAEISKLRQSIGERRFRELLRELKASNRICSSASEMVRSFDEEAGTFLRPYRHILRLIGNDRIERLKFRRTIRTLEPREKSGRGGLKSYGKELRGERDALAGSRDYWLVTNREAMNWAFQCCENVFPETKPGEWRVKTCDAPSTGLNSTRCWSSIRYRF